MNEVLAKVILHNLCVIISAVHEIGLEMPTFGQPASVNPLEASG